MKDVISSIAHTTWNCKYHIVFAPKYRRMVFFKEKKIQIGQIFIVEEEAENVREIYHLYVEENYSFGRIARKFNLLGINTKLMKNRKLANWSKEAIRKLLTNPIYKRSIAFGRRKKIKVKGTRDKYAIVNSNDYIISEGKHEAIVTPELWEQANMKIETNSKKFMDTPYARTYLWW